MRRSTGKIIVAVIALLVALAFSAIAGCGQKSENEVSASASTEASTDFSSSEADARYSFLEGVGGYKESVLIEETRLKFVDASGMAQRFDESSANSNSVSLYLAPGSTVWASITTNDFEIPGREYRILERGYLEALEADVASYRSGATSFDSTLAEISTDDNYLHFIQALASDSSFEVDSSIACLVIDASACV